MRENGSITVYMSLIFSVILALIAGSLQSVRMAYARVLTAAAAEQGLYSVFSRFDSVLLEEYELFFLDGGCGTGEWQPGNLYQTAEDTVSWILGMEEGNQILDRFSSGLTLESGSITSYTLATDNDGEAFFRQVCEAMKQNLGAYGIQQLSERLKTQETAWDAQEDQQEIGDSGQTVEEYEQAVKEAEEVKKNQAAEQESGEVSGTGEALSVSGSGENPNPDSQEGQQSVEVPQGFVNPIEVIREIQKKGVLSLVLPSGQSLPGQAVDPAQLASNRNLQEGLQVIHTEREVEFVDKLLQNEYLLWKFPCYTDHEDTKGLQCQIEYAIAGKESDMENLKSVAGQLLAAREAANVIHILGSPEKRSQVNAMAATIAAALALPIATGIVSAALIACWAFAESVLDVRELLDGGKIALVKTNSSWQLALENLPQILDGLDSLRKSSDNGLSYKDYLRILLLKEDSSEVNRKIMDLVEHNMRTRLGVPGFCMDQCIFSMGIEWNLRYAAQSLNVIREYSYGTEV